MNLLALCWTASLLFPLVVSLGIAGLLRRYALHHQILDIPNARSSHQIPTPRGGGLAIVMTFLGATVAAWLAGLVPAAVVMALGGGGGVVAAVGFCDDRGHVSRRVRFGVHSLAAVWALWCLGGLPALLVGTHSLDTGLVGDAIAAVGIVWLLNLYNFMDGIDGIAGAEAVTVAGIGGTLVFSDGAKELAWLYWLLGSSAAGFLVWNWPASKIFMGDVGSGFLGFVFGVLAIVSAKSGGLTIWVSTILLGVFLTDATVTLFRRAARGARWYEAHRSHAYQHAARRWNSHLKVTLGVCAINVFWLAPWAWLAWSRPNWAPLVTLAALVPLVILAVRLKAGIEDTPEVLG